METDKSRVNKYKLKNSLIKYRTMKIIKVEIKKKTK